MFKQTQIERFVLEHHVGEYSFDEIQQEIAHNSELIPVETGKYTTQAALHLERDTIRLMQRGKGQMGAIAPLGDVHRYLENKPLTLGQQRAIGLTTTTTDQFMAWQGMSGSGKTFALNEVKAIAQSHHFRIRGFAPSAKAAHALGKALQIEAETVAGLLCSQDNATTPEVWIVDEAGLLSMRDAHDLLNRAIANHARVILVGDTRQLSAVGAGNPFRSLQSGGMAIALDENLRQQTQELRSAVKLIAQGKVVEGFQALDQVGCVRAISTNAEAIALTHQQLNPMVQDYLNLSPAERSKTLLLAGTNRERLELTRQIRQGLQVEGSLGGNALTVLGLHPKDLTTAQAAYASAYELGDVLVPMQNYKKQGLVKHQQYVVLAKDPEANRLILETPTGQVISVDPSCCERKTVYAVQLLEVAVGGSPTETLRERLRWTKNNRDAGIRNGQVFTVHQMDADGQAHITDSDGNSAHIDLKGKQYLDYAWVSTTYSSQGKTADRVLALMDSITSKESFYVAVSRAKHHLTLYTSDKAELVQQVQRSRVKENVSDYIPLFQVVFDYAQTSKANPQPSTHTPDNRNIGKRIGERVGNRIGECIVQKFATDLCQPQQLESTNYTIRARNTTREREFDGFTTSLEREVTPLSDAIADHLEQRELVECTGSFATAVEAVNCSVEYLEYTTEKRAELAAAIDRVDAAIGAQVRRHQSGEPFESGRSPQHSRGFAEPVGISETPGLPTQLPNPFAREHYQQLWHRYSQGLPASTPLRMDRWISRRAFEDGRNRKEIALMLVAGSPYVQQLEQDQGKESAREYVNQMAQTACQRIQEPHSLKNRKDRELEV